MTEAVGFGCGMDFQQNHIYNNPEISNIWSAGAISGGELTHTGQYVNITGGIVELRTTDQENGTLFPMPFAATNFTFSVGDVAYIYLKYNGSAVNMLTTTDFIDITGQTSVEMFQIHQENASFLRYIDARNQNIGIGNKLVRRFYITDRFKWGTGAMLGNPSGLNLTVTPGIFYYGVNSVDTPSFNTLTGSTIEYYYRNGSGGFNSTIQPYANNTAYDTGTGTPITLLPNHYKTEFVFLEISSNGGDNIAIVMGQDEYTSQASAEIATVPAALPISISEMGVLIGRIVVQEGNPTILSVASAFTQQFSPSLANQHNTLAGLDGGQIGWYGHNNASESYNISKIPLKLNTSELNASVDSKVNKSNIGEATGGTLADARLSTNIPRKNSFNQFTSPLCFGNTAYCTSATVTSPFNVGTGDYGDQNNASIFLWGGTADNDQITGQAIVSHKNAGSSATFYLYNTVWNGTQMILGNVLSSKSSGGAYYEYGLSTGTGDALCINNNQVVQNSGLTTCLASTESQKINITNLSKQITPVLMQWQPKTYNSTQDGRLNYGFSAQQIERISPELVGYDQQGNISGVKYENMVAVLTKTIQEQQALLNKICSRDSSLCS